jgi:hypothetical protein
MTTFISAGQSDITIELVLVTKTVDNETINYTVTKDTLSTEDQKTYADFVNVFAANTTTIINNTDDVEMSRMTSEIINEDVVTLDYTTLSDKDKEIYNNFLLLS